MSRRSKGPHLKWREDRKIWEIVTFKNGRRERISTGTPRSEEAQRILSEHLAETYKPETSRKEPEYRLIGHVLAGYVSERGKYLKSPFTLAKCVANLTNFWGERPCSDVREETCREYQETRGIKPSAVAREISVLSAAINHDWRSGRLKYNIPVWKPKFENFKDRWLTEKEEAALLRAAKDGPKNAPYYRAAEYLPLFIMIGIYTGARHSAILELKWRQIDLKRGLIDFNDNRERTNKGRPIIKIPEKLLKMLKTASKTGARDGYVIHENQRPFKSVKKAFGEACERAGISGVTPHTLRHTCVSRLIQRGVDSMTAGRYVGHADSRTTERRYAHHNPEFFNSVTKALDNRPETTTKKKEHIKAKMKKTVKTKL